MAGAAPEAREVPPQRTLTLACPHVYMRVQMCAGRGGAGLGLCRGGWRGVTSAAGGGRTLEARPGGAAPPPLQKVVQAALCQVFGTVGGALAFEVLTQNAAGTVGTIKLARE